MCACAKRLKYVVILATKHLSTEHLYVTVQNLPSGLNMSVDTTHMFPVRRHSFSQCDRNSGVIKNKLKNLKQSAHQKRTGKLS